MYKPTFVQYLFGLLLWSIPFVSCTQEIKLAPNPAHCGPTSNQNPNVEPMKSNQKNVLGTPLQLAGTEPLTGFFRTGFCDTDANDRGVHVVAAVLTDAFLQYSKSQGNDLITPYPESGFPGLKEGDVWCLCALRWKEALAAGVAPPVVLEATNIKALEYIGLEALESHKNK